jgi:choline dehydrogenase-like flavoprotein
MHFLGVRVTVSAEEYEAIAVGSGISGGWATKELTEKGLKVLLLERGENVEHIKDYVNARKGPREYPHRGYPRAQYGKGSSTARYSRRSARPRSSAPLRSPACSTVCTSTASLARCPDRDGGG